MLWPPEITETERIITLAEMAQMIIIAATRRIESLEDIALDEEDDLDQYRDAKIAVSITPFPIKVFDEDEQVTRSEWCHEVTIYDLAKGDQFGSEGIVLNAVVSQESELYPDSEQRYCPGAWEEHVIGVARNAADILKARFSTE